MYFFRFIFQLLCNATHTGMYLFEFIYTDVFFYFCVTSRHCCAVLHRALSDCQVGCQSEKRNKRSNNNNNIKRTGTDPIIIVHYRPFDAIYRTICSHSNCVDRHSFTSSAQNKKIECILPRLHLVAKCVRSNLNSVRTLIAGQCATWECTQ